MFTTSTSFHVAAGTKIRWWIVPVSHVHVVPWDKGKMAAVPVLPAPCVFPDKEATIPTHDVCPQDKSKLWGRLPQLRFPIPEPKTMENNDRQTTESRTAQVTLPIFQTAVLGCAQQHSAPHSSVCHCLAPHSRSHSDTSPHHSQPSTLCCCQTHCCQQQTWSLL